MPLGIRINKAQAIVPVNEDFQVAKILKNAQKELIELLLLESEAIIEKIQLEVDNLVNTLFPKDQEEVKKHLKEKNRKLKEQRNGNGKWKEKK